MAGTKRLRAVWMLVAAFGAGGCEVGKTCTDVGCISGVSLSLAPRAASWEDGEYALQLDLDGRKLDCTFTVGASAESSFDCGRDIRVHLRQTAELRVAEVLIDVTGEPKNLATTLSRDGAVVLSDRRQPDYVESQPNVGCEPICQRAQVELTAE